MFRAPSLQHEYTLVFSGDPALDLPVDEAERETALRVARETGNWEPILKQGQIPTLFHVRQLTQSSARWLGGEIRRRRLEPGEISVLALRLALRRVDNFDGHRVRHEQIDDQELATIATIDMLFEVDPSNLDIGRTLVDELGSLVLQRASEGISPKR